ncbi:MAG: DinB family protein [Dehalococcoidia bacterium]
MTTEPTGTQPDRSALRAELESTRKDFHELLVSLSDEDWKKKSANPAWSVGQLVWHLTWGLEFTPKAVGYCRKGKAPNPPSWLVAPGNVLITRFGSRGATRASAGEKYDRSHAVILETLGGVRDDEWHKGTRAYGIDYTIESLFREVSAHFREHEADIMKGLGRV